MTLNLAHGRGEAAHQVLLKREQFRRNLRAAADFLRRERPDVVALQEADGPSAWSGGFDHVAELARLAGYPHHFRGAHVDTGKISYGTALLSRFPLLDARSHRFLPSPPTLPKGFVVATVRGIHVASVHLDFLSPGARRAQIDLLARALKARGRPLVVLGDFNSAWDGRELGLRTARRSDRTFPAHDPKRRLDWIFVSPDLSLESYVVLPDRVSDHRPVVARIRGR